MSLSKVAIPFGGGCGFTMSGNVLGFHLVDIDIGIELGFDKNLLLMGERIKK